MMKRLWIIGVLMMMLCGCASVEDFETMKDVYAPQNLSDPAQISLIIPADAASPVMESENGKLYFCDGYEIMVQTMEAGDLNSTLESLTGYTKDSLTVIETMTDDVRRYECVWTAAGEAGDQVGRAVIMDDGSYHYCVSVMAHALESGSLQETWQELFTSFKIQS
jgi:hypothetical protein